MTDPDTHDIAEDRTASDLAPDNKIAGIQRNWNTAADWDSHDYASIPVPREEDRPKWEWDFKERRAWLLTQLRDYGTWDNVPMTQRECANDFGVPQPSIFNDLKELRRYIRFHAGNRAISVTETVAQKAVSEQLEDGDYFKALQAQLDYNEFLFELGRIERAPDRKQVHNINQDIDDAELTDEQKGHMQDLSKKVQQSKAQDDEIVVENTEEEGDG